MRPLPVVVDLGILVQHVLQHRLAEDDHPAHALFPDRPDEPLGIGVQVRAVRRQGNGLQARRPQDPSAAVVHFQFDFDEVDQQFLPPILKNRAVLPF